MLDSAAGYRIAHFVTFNVALFPPLLRKVNLFNVFTLRVVTTN